MNQLSNVYLILKVLSTTVGAMTRAWAAVAVTVVLWATAFAAIRAALEDYTAAELSVLRLAVASLALAGVVAVAGRGRPASRDLPRLALVALTRMSAYQLLLNAGEQTVDAGTAALLVSTGPVFVAVMAATFLRERLDAAAWAGVAIGFTGAAIIAVGQGGGVGVSADALLVLGAAVSQAVFFVLQKPLLPRYGSLRVTAWAMWLGALALVPFAPAAPAAVVTASTEASAAVLFLGLGASALGFLTWAYALGRLEVHRAASFLYAVPVVAIAVAWAWLGEVPGVLSLVGGAVALAGVAVTNRRSTTRRRPGTRPHADRARTGARYWRPRRRDRRARSTGTATGRRAAAVRAAGPRQARTRRGRTGRVR
jgi:drug/metabolite transporter (DMT)-like permease